MSIKLTLFSRLSYGGGGVGKGFPRIFESGELQIFLRGHLQIFFMNHLQIFFI